VTATDELRASRKAPHEGSLGFGRWLLRTVVGGTVLGLLMFVVYVMVAMIR
jgi:hypothetical protein